MTKAFLVLQKKIQFDYGSDEDIMKQKRMEMKDAPIQRKEKSLRERFQLL